MPQKIIIEVKNLDVTYFPGKENEVKALSGINMQINEGDFVILFGPSGCGKSTLLYSIAGLERRVKGDILIDGANIATMKNRDIEKFHQTKIGMIFQAYYLINSLTILKNVILPQLTINRGRKEREERAKYLLEYFGVGKQMNKLPSELSGGQQQRVAIARSLVNDPQILLADEPVGNLDSKSANDVIGLLKQLNKEQKKTVILVTHDPSFLVIADKVFHIRDGQLIKVEINQGGQLVEDKKEKDKPVISRELELLARVFSGVRNLTGSLLDPFKAKEVVMEILTGLSSEEIKRIEKVVESAFVTGRLGGADLCNFLDAREQEGGLEMNKKTAQYVSAKIDGVLGLINSFNKEEVGENGLPLNEKEAMTKRVLAIRHHLLNEFESGHVDLPALEAMNYVIEKRLESEINYYDVRTKLDLPVREGGAGLDRRTAKKMAKRIELIALGRYR